MKIIFLDVDGVLNNQIFPQSFGSPAEFSKYKDTVGYPKCEVVPNLIKLLNHVTDSTGAKIVVSSTWRNNDKGLEGVKELCKLWGITGEVIDTTPALSSCRGLEIKQFIEDCEEEIEDYIILDDDSDFLLKQGRHFFQCDNYYGISPNVAYRAIRYLNNKDI